MEKFPSSNVYIVKVSDSIYFSFLENRDGTRIKFFGTGEVISVGQLNPYIQSAYGKSPEWIRCMQGSNHFFTPTKPHFTDSAPRTPIQSISIYDELTKMIGNAPKLDDFEVDDYDGASSKKEHKRNERLKEKYYKKAEASFETHRKHYPKLPYGSVTAEEICDIMSWYAQQDKEAKTMQQSSPSYTEPSVLDF